jgi:hypothetical protein
VVAEKKVGAPHRAGRSGRNGRHGFSFQRRKIMDLQEASLSELERVEGGGPDGGTSKHDNCMKVCMDGHADRDTCEKICKRE